MHMCPKYSKMKRLTRLKLADIPESGKLSSRSVSDFSTRSCKGTDLESRLLDRGVCSGTVIWVDLHINLGSQASTTEQSTPACLLQLLLHCLSKACDQRIIRQILYDAATKA